MAFAKQCDICGRFFKDAYEGNFLRHPNEVIIHSASSQEHFVGVPPILAPKKSKGTAIASLMYDVCPSCVTEIMSTISDIRKGSCFDG